MQSDQPEAYDPYDPPARPPSTFPVLIPAEPYGGIRPIPSQRQGLGILLLITVLVIAAGGVGGHFFLRWLNGRETAGQVDLETAIARDHPSKLHAVNRIDNLRRLPVTDKTLEKKMIDLLDGSLGVGKPFVVMYGDPAAKDARGGVFLVGTTQRIENPLAALLLDGFKDIAKASGGSIGALTADEGSTVGPMKVMDPGPPGGLVLCAAVKDPKEPYSACAWADFGSRGIAAVLGVTPAEAARTLARVRSAIIIRPSSQAN